jgi:hypothetical protein
LELPWKALMARFVKINWDVHMDKKLMKMDIGVIIRDYMGEVMAMLS